MFCVLLVCLSYKVEMAVKHMEYSALDDSQVASELQFAACSVCC